MLMLSTGLITCDDACLEQTLGDGDLEPGTYAYLEVADDGCGMSPETVARMFDPFFSTKLTGRGLGLASVLGIVRAHHGAVSVRSVAGQGTAVRILFPTARSM
jgi:signal transduction histidine kinase